MVIWLEGHSLFFFFSFVKKIFYYISIIWLERNVSFIYNDYSFFFSSIVGLILPSLPLFRFHSGLPHLEVRFLCHRPIPILKNCISISIYLILFFFHWYFLMFSLFCFLSHSLSVSIIVYLIFFVFTIIYYILFAFSIIYYHFTIFYYHLPNYIYFYNHSRSFYHIYYHFNNSFCFFLLSFTIISIILFVLTIFS